MIFATHWFFLFTAAFFPIYWLLWRPIPRAAALFAACTFFHWHFAGPGGALPIVVLGVVTYLCALTLRRALCLGAITLCGSPLIFYKYTLFLSTNVIGALDGEWGENRRRQSQGLPPRRAAPRSQFFRLRVRSLSH